ncbi:MULTISPECIES: peptide-methionine (S)-S-oxide reductase MsrA [unclassified Pseudoalteromonas]|uniref:peptide-methionine (S)-S-oxide reductase MsrA n=1 Tax=unclassified Pseudoalteromonas TaxID=194690 RepID=UPI001B3A478C|nr:MULTISPECIES: peptide-methionine (S)-S-oxide reductase MsrA [unclassified Pseudoalteromonas]MBQ4846487.1 peptide-methionine (S)-S-oxide reductase MsrA [Pseudoalteromonas sp. MMG005]MBQ4849392.1 peptide-methionine (S)-S-oxide reductase MsrA [Pseudoalteromonas sp. MMG012]
MTSIKKATFGGGCFWCIDAAFRRVRGVTSVRSGYTGGHTPEPTYKAICQGDSGHAEVVEVSFDSTMVNYDTLLAMFFTLHDPTQLNRQGNDIGTQYRSVIYYHDEYQHRTISDTITNIQQQISAPIVTEVSEAQTFYAAEDYHQDYFNENPNQGYCSMLIAPKIAKFEQRFVNNID